ncbi:MAG: DUF2156 domain-containing protein [Synergistales bacterium]|jgi:hypothetical protein
MELNWEPLFLGKREDYRSRFGRTPEPSAHYTFASLWGWNVNCAYEWAWDGPLVWIRANRPSRTCMAPVGDWDAVDWAETLPKRWSPGTVFKDVPMGLARRWEQALPGRIRLEPSRGEWEYVHRVEDLVTLKGNRFRTKAQKLRRFVTTYHPEFVSIGPENLAEVAAFQEKWCRVRSCGSEKALEEENRAIEATFRDWDRLPGLFGGALKVDGRMLAYTLAEPLDGLTVVIRFEKGCPDFRDVYQAMNQLFLERCCGAFVWVNREEDLDDPGLREAKMSYRPDRFLEKATVTLE